jgi:hypothetical protein
LNSVPDIAGSGDLSPQRLATLADAELLERVQRQTFRFIWEAAHPVSGLVPDRRPSGKGQTADLITTGGSGFALMTLIVAVERGWIRREQALERLEAMLAVLARASCYHGALPHFLDGRSGATIPFSRKDDGGDLVETSFLCMGLLTARQYFDRQTPAETRLRQAMTGLWEEVEWDWYTRAARGVLYWHWSANNGWALGHEIRGWNECLITYVLAAGAPRYPIDSHVYHRGFATGREFINGRTWSGIELPLGPPSGGPLFFAHYSFCGLDPRGLEDRYANYWEQNRRHVLINHAHCVANPHHHPGYGEHCWGLTASDDPDGYAVHSPESDNGTIAPTAALASFPYAPEQAMKALRHFLGAFGERVWRPQGFVDAFCLRRDWYADSHLAIDQAPIVIMIENFRTGLLWRLFMSAPEVLAGLRRLGFSSPHLPPRG